MWHNVKNIFHFMIIFQCLIFSFYLLSQKTQRRQRNLILIAFLISIIFVEMSGVAMHFLELKKILILHCPKLIYLINPFHYIYVPLLFLYILSFTRQNFKINKTALLHFIPFLFIFILFLLKYVFNDSASLKSYLETTSFFNYTEDRIYDFIKFIQFFSYGIASLIVLKNYDIKIKNHFSSIEGINLSWLKFVVLGFIFWKLLRFIDLILWINFRDSTPHHIYFYISAEVLFLIFLSSMFLKGLKQPLIFSANNRDHLKQKYEKILLSDDRKEEYRNRLLHYMETKKPYLNPSLSLQELAEKLSIPSHHLSQVLNTSLKQKFFDFINSYRIEESKMLLLEDTSNKKIILEILYKTGFNSKSVFNTAFKKHTGMTPTQFRNLHNS